MTDNQKQEAGSKKPPPGGVTLRAEGLTFSYGDSAAPAVDDVSLSLPPGQILALVGPNGCGKSTLLRLLCGQLRPHAGKVTVECPVSSFQCPVEGAAAARSGHWTLDTGHSPSPSPFQLARLIALVPQSTTVGFDYSVRQMVLMARWPTHAGSGTFATALGFETPEDQRLADEAMWIMDVHHLADRPITHLSGGERQRVIVARALAQHTPLLMLDEPTSALDLWHQLELFAHLRTLARQEARGVLIITHDLNHALEHADRVVLMDRGRVVAAGPPAEVLTPKNLEPVYRIQVRVDGYLRFARPPLPPLPPLPPPSPPPPSSSLPS